MQLRVNPEGTILGLYQEGVDLKELGNQTIERASHVEPNGANWVVDLSPVNGPKLEGFLNRSIAIQAEVDWIENHVL